ncbi:unnamed protein product [Calypogeia fissa]
MAGRGGAQKLILGVSETKVKNFAVAGCLTAFVGSVYFYTMKAVGGTDQLQATVEAFEREKASSTTAMSQAQSQSAPTSP